MSWCNKLSNYKRSELILHQLFRGLSDLYLVFISAQIYYVNFYKYLICHLFLQLGCLSRDPYFFQAPCWKKNNFGQSYHGKIFFLHFFHFLGGLFWRKFSLAMQSFGQGFWGLTWHNAYIWVLWRKKWNLLKNPTAIGFEKAARMCGSFYANFQNIYVCWYLVRSTQQSSSVGQNKISKAANHIFFFGWFYSGTT